MSNQENSLAKSWVECGVDIGVLLGSILVVPFVITLLIAKVSLIWLATALIALFFIGFAGWAADWKIQNVINGVRRLGEGNSFTKIMISIATLCMIAGIVWGFTY